MFYPALSAQTDYLLGYWEAEHCSSESEQADNNLVSYKEMRNRIAFIIIINVADILGIS